MHIRSVISSLVLLVMLTIAGPVKSQTAPANVEVTPKDGIVDFMWDDPMNSAISHYQWRYKRSDRLWSAWADLPNSDADTTEFSAYGLINGISYRFQIRAVVGETTRSLLQNSQRGDAYFPVYVREHGTMYLDLGKDILNGNPIARYLSTNGSPPPLTQEQYNTLDKWQYRFTKPARIEDGVITSWHPWQTPWVDMSRGAGNCGVGKERICFRMQGLQKYTYHLYQFRMVFNAKAGPAAEAFNVVPGDPPLKLSIAGLNRPFTEEDFDKDITKRKHRMIVFTFSEKVTGFTSDDIDVECAFKETDLLHVALMQTLEGEKDIYRIFVRPTICQEDNPAVKVTVKASSVMYKGTEGGNEVEKNGPENAVTTEADCPVCSPNYQRLTTAPVQNSPTEQNTCAATDSNLINKVRGYHQLNSKRPDYNHNWFRVLMAFGAETHATLRPYTAAEARRGENIWSGWRPVRAELERLEACRLTTAARQQSAPEDVEVLPTLPVRDTSDPEGVNMPFMIILSEPSN